ncbi:MAG TPA: hypothetical protein VD969_23400 [Symbiobacteriaceae bacterium]|nr:hypothetical protein [Symbiobacteriaceae bacterium]
MRRTLLPAAVLKFFTTESQEKPREIFEQVHYPMDRIKVEFCKVGNPGQFAHESEIAGWVLAVDGSVRNNRIFSVVGETGSGKSEFCQYLQYQAAGSPHHVPVLISRSTTKLGQIIGLLNQHAGAEAEADITEVTDLTEAHIVTQSVAYVMRVTLTQQFKNRYSPEQLRTLERIFQDNGFKALLARSFNEYRAQVTDLGKEREMNLLDRREFDLLLSNLTPWLDLDTAYVACRDQIYEGIKELIKVGDMTGRLERISKRYQAMKKRPLLIMEDLTSFGFMKEELLDFLFQLNSGNFDVVIGWTTGFEAENLGSIFRVTGDAFTYMQERLQGRFTMTDSQRTSWFLEEHHVPMTARYIAAARSESGINMPPGSLYPVNAAFVTNLYQRLLDFDTKQPKKTPRILLQAMMTILTSPDEPWVAATNMTGSRLAAKPLPGRLFDLEEEYPDEVRFLEWYGRPSDGKVSRRDAEQLGIQLPPELADYLIEDEPVPVVDKPVVPTRAVEVAGATAVETRGAPEAQVPARTAEEPAAYAVAVGTGAQPVVKPPEPKPVEPERKPDPLEKENLDIQQWLQGKDLNLRRVAERGLEYLLSAYGDAAGIANPRSGNTPVLQYQKQRLHVVFEGTSDKEESFPTLFVPRDRKARSYILTALTTRSRAQADEAFLKEPGLVQWLGRLFDSYRAVQRTYLKKRLGMSVERFVYHLYVTVVGLSTGETGQNLDSLIRFDPAREPGALQLAALKNSVEAKQLLRYRRTVTNLFRSFFFLNPTTLDLPLLCAAASGYSPHAFGKAAASAAQESIDQGFGLIIDPSERAREEKVLVSELFTLCHSLDGRLRAARQEFGPDQERMQESQVRRLAAGLTAEGYREALGRVERLMAACKIPKVQEEWRALTDQAIADFGGTAAALEAVAAKAAAAGDAFALVAAHEAHRTAGDRPEVQALRTMAALLKRLDEDIVQAEKGLADKKFYNQGGKPAEECKWYYQSLRATLGEVTA